MTFMKNKNETYNVQSSTKVAEGANHPSGYRVYFTGTKEECWAYSRSTQFSETQKPFTYKSRGCAIWPSSYIDEMV